MSTQNRLQIPLSYVRTARFAVEVLDSVNLEILNKGIGVVAVGLERLPVVNASGRFVWLDGDISNLKGLRIDPGTRPYEQVELDLKQIQQPLTKIELSPLTSYSFTTGVTGLRGVLKETEDRPNRASPAVTDATFELQWKGEDEKWHTGTTSTRSNRDGSFVSFVRLSRDDEPEENGNEITVRLRVVRPRASPRYSKELNLDVGQITNPTPSNDTLIFAWKNLRLELSI
jgi:hypothetical protein